MQGIQFGSYHSFDDFGLVLSSKEIGTPEPKTITIDVEGSDGVLDFTEFAGQVKFRNRKLVFNFSKPNILDDFMQIYSEVVNALHGKKMNISLDEDSGFYYVGRITVNEFTSDANIGRIVIECDCEPWKYKVNQTVVVETISGSKTVNLLNLKKSVVPTITTTAEMTFVFGGISRTVAAGTFKIPELELKEGSNTVAITGTGTVIFSYQEGGL